MPTIHVTPFPQDTPWQDFEKMTLHAMSLKWESPNLQGEGRPGQGQDGVDIFGSDYLGRPVGIQCKKYSGVLKIDVVQKEVKLAEAFKGATLNCLYIATTAPHDVKLQRAVRALSEERVKEGKFAVGILYWDDIFTGLLLDNNILISHFPYLKFPDPTIVNSTKANKLSAFMLGYYGSFLLDYLELVFSEFGWMAQQDPEEIRTVLRIIRQNCKIAPKEQVVEITAWIDEIESELFMAKPKKDWEKIKLLSKRVRDRSKYLSSLLENFETASFIELGLNIGAVNWTDGKFTEELANKLAQKIYMLLIGATTLLPKTLDRIIDKDCYTAGPVLYNFVDRELRWGDY